MPGAPTDLPLVASTPRSHARSCLLTNLLVLPGLGTWVAGNRLVGIGQMIFAGAGFIVSLWFATWFTRTWYRTGTAPLEAWPQLKIALAGVTCFLCGWTWGLATGMGLVRRARHDGNRLTAVERE